MDGLSLASCVFVWFDTHDPEAVREHHERVCIPLENARRAWIDRVCRETLERIDREYASVETKMPLPLVKDSGETKLTEVR